MAHTTEFLIVMTASITPATDVAHFRSDPKVRLEDYKNALRFWLAQPNERLNRILFLENTGSDISELQSIASDENSLNKEVEFISMRGNNIPKKRHYGYGEMQMLDEGLSKSILRRHTTHMIKVTGRLTFPSIGKLMTKLPQQFDVFIECRVPLHSFNNKTNPLTVIKNRISAYASCQLMIFSHEFYERELQKRYPDLAPAFPGSYPHLIENLIYDRVIQFEGQAGIYLRWPINVEPVGFAGHKNKNYGDPRRVLLNMTRSAFRRLWPDFWL